MKKHRTRTRAICRLCKKEMNRNQIVRHWIKEHPKEYYEKGRSMHGGWGHVDLSGTIWVHLADPLPGEVL